MQAAERSHADHTVTTLLLLELIAGQSAVKSADQPFNDVSSRRLDSISFTYSDINQRLMIIIMSLSTEVRYTCGRWTMSCIFSISTVLLTPVDVIAWRYRFVSASVYNSIETVIWTNEVDIGVECVDEDMEISNRWENWIVLFRHFGFIFNYGWKWIWTQFCDWLEFSNF